MAISSLKTICFRDLTLEELENWMRDQGEQPFRARQLFQWLWQKGESDISRFSNLSMALRAKLTSLGYTEAVSLVQVTGDDPTRTRKLLVSLNDGHYVETVLIPNSDSATVCVSTQVGCPLACAFCATGKLGLKRNLTAGEIAQQVLLAQQLTSFRVNRVVFMGMGEPFANYEASLKAADILHSELGLGLGARRITISTAGVVPGIRRFIAEQRPYQLAISLNATTDELRDKLMPLNRRWPLDELLVVAREFSHNRRDVLTFEYVLLRGVNDSPADARRLIGLLGGLRCKLNLIPYNETEGDFKRPTENDVEYFFHYLRKAPFPVTIRWSRGRKVKAACGQLVAISQVVAEPSGG